MRSLGNTVPKAPFIRRGDALGSTEALAPAAETGLDASRTDALGILFSLSRRHDLPFGVLVVSAAPSRNEAARSPAPIAHWIDGETRRTDAVFDWGADAAVVGCPATSPDGVRALAKRLRASANGRAIRVGTASFREDALTLDDLIAHASERAHEGHRSERPPKGPHGPLRPLSPEGGRPVGNGTSPTVKRLFDLFLVVATAPLWLFVLVLAAAAVKISDPRAPVLFVQERTGRGGARFRFYKLRTMVTDAEELKDELSARNQRSWPDFKIDDDPRITPIGHFLRATSIDELPQMWNVLRGDMSLVGPRPTSFPAETYEAWQTARLEATPGLTGLWQVDGRQCTDFCERIRIDLRYVERRGFLYDLKLLVRTVPVVLWKRDGR